MTRQIVTRSPVRQVGVVNPSWLLNHSVEHESDLERRFILVALACPELVDITHQPFTLELNLGDGVISKYTPDFLIELADGDQVVVEVKPEVFVKKHETRLVAAKRHLLQDGLKFLVITDTSIDKNGLSSRAMLLMRYGRMYIDPEQVRECKRLIEAQAEESVEVHKLLSMGVAEQTIWKMVAEHRLRVPAGLNINLHENVAMNDQFENCYLRFLEWFSLSADQSI